MKIPSPVMIQIYTKFCMISLNMYISPIRNEKFRNAYCFGNKTLKRITMVLKIIIEINKILLNLVFLYIGKQKKKFITTEGPSTLPIMEADKMATKRKILKL